MGSEQPRFCAQAGRRSYLPTRELRAEGKQESVGNQQASPQEWALDLGLAHTSLQALNQRSWQQPVWDRGPPVSAVTRFGLPGAWQKGRHQYLQKLGGMSIRKCLG